MLVSTMDLNRCFAFYLRKVKLQDARVVPRMESTKPCAKSDVGGIKFHVVLCCVALWKSPPRITSRTLHACLRVAPTSATAGPAKLVGGRCMYAILFVNTVMSQLTPNRTSPSISFQFISEGNLTLSGSRALVCQILGFQKWRPDVFCQHRWRCTCSAQASHGTRDNPLTIDPSDHVSSSVFAQSEQQEPMAWASHTMLSLFRGPLLQ